MENAEDALKAIEAAQGAFARWSSVSVRERAIILNKVARLMKTKVKQNRANISC